MSTGADYNEDYNYSYGNTLLTGLNGGLQDSSVGSNYNGISSPISDSSRRKSAVLPILPSNKISQLQKIGTGLR